MLGKHLVAVRVGKCPDEIFPNPPFSLRFLPLLVWRKSSPEVCRTECAISRVTRYLVYIRYYFVDEGFRAIKWFRPILQSSGVAGGPSDKTAGENVTVGNGYRIRWEPESIVWRG